MEQLCCELTENKTPLQVCSLINLPVWVCGVRARVRWAENSTQPLLGFALILTIINLNVIKFNNKFCWVVHSANSSAHSFRTETPSPVLGEPLKPWKVGVVVKCWAVNILLVCFYLKLNLGGFTCKFYQVPVFVQPLLCVWIFFFSSH